MTTPATPPKEMRYVTELESELLSAARRRRHAPALGTALAHRPRATTLVPAATVAGALGIATLALVLVGTHGHRRATGTHAATQTAAAVPAAARPLVREFAVLRRPETAADRAFAASSPPAVFGSGFPWRTVPGLTRLLARLPNGDRLYLQVIARSRPARLSVARVGDIAMLDIATGNSVSGNAITTARGGALSRLLPVPFRLGSSEVEVVPDSITRVVWRFAGGRTVTPRIANNVAIASFLHGATPPVGPVVARLSGRDSVSAITRVSRARFAVLPPGLRSARRVATVRLRGPGRRPSAAGTVTILRASGRLAIRIRATGLPAETPGKGSYAIWLCRPGSWSGCDFLGFPDTTVGRNGRLDAEGSVPVNIPRDRRILIALQTSHPAVRPGRVVLTALASAGSL